MEKRKKAYVDSVEILPYEHYGEPYWWYNHIRRYRDGFKASYNHFERRKVGNKGSPPALREKQSKQSWQYVYDSIRQQRRNRAVDRSDKMVFQCHRYGGCFKEPNTFLQKGLSFELKKEKGLKYKKPATLVKHIGIEFEIVSHLKADAVLKKVIDHNLHDLVFIKSDGSIKPERTNGHEEDCGVLEKEDCNCGNHSFGQNTPVGHEICVLLKQSERLKSTIQRVCEFLKDIDAISNWTCGLHVHLDVRKRDFKKVFQNFILCQRILFSLVPKKRQLNNFCKPYYGVDPIGQNDRYYAINGTAKNSHDTIEIRLHHGTVDFKTVYNWVRLLIRIADAKPLTQPVYTFAHLRRRVPLGRNNRIWILNRMKKFGGYTKIPFSPRIDEYHKKKVEARNGSGITQEQLNSLLMPQPSQNVYIPGSPAAQAEQLFRIPWLPLL